MRGGAKVLLGAVFWVELGATTAGCEVLELALLLDAGTGTTEAVLVTREVLMIPGGIW